MKHSCKLACTCNSCIKEIQKHISINELEQNIKKAIKNIRRLRKKWLPGNATEQGEHKIL